jgi:glycosyltransferase involved in cell wall biosynthesis
MTDCAPNYVHVATEGPIGIQMRRACLHQGIPFTTGFHTMFPDYCWQIAYIPTSLTWPIFRRFHSRAASTLAPSNATVSLLKEKGFQNVKLWSRGIDPACFYPQAPILDHLKKPIYLYTGRVSREKNIEAFLKLPLPGTKVVVGDGPARAALELAYRDSIFLGYREGKELAQLYSSADVFVFPSLTDTFGNVVLEALACGTPVAAHETGGPLDILTDRRLGACSVDLLEAIQLAQRYGDRRFCADYARSFSWQEATRTFMSYLVPVPGQ